MACWLTTATFAAEENKLEQIEQTGIARSAEGREAQRSVNQIHDGNRELSDEYRKELKLVDGLNTYIGLLDAQLTNQTTEIEILRNSISDVAVLERQILPLLMRMIDSLERFISLDVPFLLEERKKRTEKLRQLMTRSDVAVAEKARRVLEAYQIENEFGRTIESYTAKLDLTGSSFDAEFLRIGRLSLLYRTFGANQVGFWDVESGDWQTLERTPWERMIQQGIRVARQEVAPQLVHVPVNPAKLAQVDNSQSTVAAGGQ